MSVCVSCGLSIPEGQGKSCSMCYGDIDYGRDGYYRQQMEESMRRSAERAAEEEQERGE